MDFLRCALVGETVRLEGVARGGAVGVGAVLGVDVAHGLGCTIEIKIEMAPGGRVSRIGAGRCGLYSQSLIARAYISGCLYPRSR